MHKAGKQQTELESEWLTEMGLGWAYRVWGVLGDLGEGLRKGGFVMS